MSLSTKKSISIGRKKVNPLHKLNTVKEETNEGSLAKETVEERSFFETLSTELQSNKAYISVNAVLDGSLKREKNELIQFLKLPISAKAFPGQDLDKNFIQSIKIAQLSEDQINSLRFIGQTNEAAMRSEAMHQTDSIADHFVHACIIAQTILVENTFTDPDKLEAAQTIGNYHVEQFVKNMVGSEVQKDDMEKYRAIVLDGINEMFDASINNKQKQTTSDLMSEVNSNVTFTSASASPNSSSSLLDDIMEIKSIPRTSKSNSIYDQVTGAAVLIQSVYKGYTTRKSVCSVRTQVSIRTIQRWYRTKWHTSKERTEYLNFRKSVVKFQALLRGRRVRRKIEITNQLLLNDQMIQLFNRFHNAATIIQAVVRGMITRIRIHTAIATQYQVKVALQYRARIVGSVVKFQSYVRGYLVREANRKYNEEISNFLLIRDQLAEEEEVLSGLSRSLVYWHAESSYVNEIVECFLVNNHYARAAIQLQRFFRQVRLRKHAAGIIQRTWRGFRIRAYIRLWIIYAITIQKSARRYLAKLRVMRIKRSLALEKMAIRFAFYEKNQPKIIIVQKICRKWVCMKRLEITRRSLRIFQRHMKTINGFVRILQARLAVRKRRRHITRLQHCCRSLLRKRRYNIMIKRITKAQAYCRMQIGKAKVRKWKFLILWLQATQRSRAQRNSYDKVLKCLIKLQGYFRMKKARSRYSLYFEALRRVQPLIQRYLFRVHMCKAIRKRRLVKSFLWACIVRKRYLSIRRKIITLQSLARKMLDIKWVAKRNHAAVWLQMCFRTKQFYKYLQLRRRQAVLLQKLIRRRLKQNWFLYLRRNVILIQSHFRKKLSFLHVVKMHTTSTLLSSLWRRYIVDKEIFYRNQSAKVIQKQIRGSQTRLLLYCSDDKPKANFITKLYAKWLKEQQLHEQRKQKHAATIQSLCRMYIQKIRYKAVLRKYILVQSLCRRFLAYLGIFRECGFSEHYKLDGTFPAIILRHGNISMTYDVYYFDGSIVRNKRQKNLLHLDFYTDMYTPHRLRVGDLVDASIYHGEQKYPGTIVNVYPGCYHYDVLFEGDVVPSKYISIKNIHLLHCKYQSNASSAPWKYYINENVETSDDKWRTTSRAYVLKEKVICNSKLLGHHNKMVYSLQIIGSKEIRHNVPSYCIRKCFRKYRPGLDVEAPCNSGKKSSAELYRIGQICSVENATNSCEVMFRGSSPSCKLIPFSKIRVLRGKYYEIGDKVLVANFRRASNQQQFFVRKVFNQHELSTRSATITSRGDYSQFYNVSFPTGKPASACVHFSLLSDFRTKKRKLYDIIRVKMDRVDFTVKKLLHKYVSGIRHNFKIWSVFQAHVRRQQQRKSYLQARQKVVLIQALARRKCFEIKAGVLDSKAAKIQKNVRRFQKVMEFQIIRMLIIKLQSIVRLFLCRCKYMKSRSKLTKLQAFIRGIVSRKRLLEEWRIQEGLRGEITYELNNEEYNIVLEDGTYLSNVRKCCLTKGSRVNEEWLKSGTRVDATEDNWLTHFAGTITGVTWNGLYSIIFDDTSSMVEALVPRNGVRPLHGDADLALSYKWHSRLEMTLDRWNSFFLVQVTKKLKGNCYNVQVLDKGKLNRKIYTNVKHSFLREPFKITDLTRNSEVEYSTPSRKLKYSIGIIDAVNYDKRICRLIDKLSNVKIRGVEFAKIRPIPQNFYELNSLVIIKSSQQIGAIHSRNKANRYTVKLQNGKFAYRLGAHEIFGITKYNLREKILYLPHKDPYRQGNTKMSFLEMLVHSHHGRLKQKSYAKAAIKIQSCYRTWMCRGKYLRALNIWHENRAATSIQSFIRGKKIRNEIEFLSQLVIKIQRAFRQHLYKKYGNYSKHQIDSLIIIQKYTRAYIYHMQYNKIVLAALMVQKFFRSLHLRLKFLRAVGFSLKDRNVFKILNVTRLNRKKAVLQIQKRIRGWLARSTVAKVSAAITLQRYTRGYISRAALWKQLPETKDFECDGYFPGTVLRRNKNGTFGVEFENGQVCHSIGYNLIRNNFFNCFKVGDRCEASEDGWYTYLEGTVVDILQNNINSRQSINYTVRYDDGSLVSSISRQNIRPVNKTGHRFKIGEVVEVTRGKWRDRQIGFILDIRQGNKGHKKYRVRLKTADGSKVIVGNVEQYRIRPFMEFENGCRVEATKSEWRRIYYEGTVINLRSDTRDFGVLFDDGEYFESDELLDVRRRLFSLYDVGDNVLVKFKDSADPLVGVVHAVSRNKCFYDVGFQGKQVDAELVKKVHVSSILYQVKKNWKTFDSVFAKVEGLRFIEKIMMYREGKKFSALKLRAVLLIQKFGRRWLAKLKVDKNFLEGNTSQRLPMYASVIRPSNPTGKGHPTFNENARLDSDSDKIMHSYIERAIQKYLEKNLELSSSVHTRGKAPSTRIGRNHSYSENHSVEFSRIIESRIQDKVKEYIDKNGIESSNSSNHFDKPRFDSLGIDNFDTAHSDTAESISTITTATTYGSTYSLGDQVLATHHDWDDQYFPGRIAGINNDGTYSIKFQDGDFSPNTLPKYVKRYPAVNDEESDREASVANSNETVKGYAHEEVSKYVVGDIVLATHYDWEDQYYPGRIINVNVDRTYAVRFFDGELAKAIHVNHVTEIPYKNNDRVFARQENWAEAFPGRIDRLNHDGTYTVAFDDGDSADISIKNIRGI